MNKILCIDDKDSNLLSLEGILGKYYDVTLSNSPEQGREMALGGGYQLVIIENQLNGVTGLQVAQEISRANIDCLCILLTSEPMDSYTYPPRPTSFTTTSSSPSAVNTCCKKWTAHC